MNLVRVCVLGQLAVERATVAVPIDDIEHRRVLAALAVSRHDTVTRSELADLLAVSDAHIEHVVRSLADELGDDIVVTRGSRVFLALDACDADHAESLIAGARRMDGAAAIDQLDRAIGLWRGPALEEFASTSWAHAEAARLDELLTIARDDRLALTLAMQPVDERDRRNGPPFDADDPDGHQLDRHQLDGHQLDRHRGDARSYSRRTFLFTDIVNSTSLWEQHGDTMSASLRIHDRLARDAISRHGGTIFGNPGDGFSAVFERDHEAVAAATTLQDALSHVDFAGGPTISVRMGIHAGPAEFRDRNYFGPAVNQAARICDAGHGGQTLIGPSIERSRNVVTRALGEHLLKGVAAPVALEQIGTAEFGPLRAVDKRRSNLGVAPNELIGRRVDRDAVVSLLSGSRLVTVTGIGGVGKTRLTTAVGEASLQRFSDGVWFARLAPCVDGRSVLSAIADAVGVPVPSDAARLGELVRGHELLLILDNCEHVVDDVARICSELLATTTRLRIVASSRERLGVAGEHLYPLAPLASVDDASLVFRQRAIGAGVDAATLDPAVLREICDRLDRIPLAIELAAATCRLLPAAQLLGRLGQRFDVLRGTSRRPTDGRHETLRGVIDWSYESLDEQQQRFFRRLAVFAGGFGIDAAEEVAADLTEPALFLLSDLVDRSLVDVVTADGHARYAMLETLREYARDRSAELGESTELADLLVAWCRRHVSATASLASGSTEDAAIADLVLEAPNVRAAIAALIARGDPVGAADLVLEFEEFASSANPLAELVEPIIDTGVVADHHGGRRLLGMELIRRSISEGTAGRAELASELRSALRADDPGSLQMPVLLIASAFENDDDEAYFREVVDAAHAQTDPVERARLLVAALLGISFAAHVPKRPVFVTEVAEAIRTAGLARLMIPLAASVCMAALTTGRTQEAIEFVQPILDELDRLPTPSIMSSGFVVTYTEIAVRADAPAGELVAAVRRLGPILQGDFNRLGLALARIVDHLGETELALQAVGACSRDGRSRFSTAQIATIIDHGRRLLGDEATDAALADGARRERSDLYRSMWSTLQPTFHEASRRSDQYDAVP